jgi:hypothetical protein
VPKLEGDQRDVTSITSIVRGIDERYGPKKDLTLMDNNIAASPNFKNIIAEIRDLGFTPGAKLTRPGRLPVQRRVDFNQGVDARILCKDPMYLREMSKICINPLRIAFDHIGLRKPYETAIRYAHEFGLSDLSNYMLYNFHDSPSDLYHRMRLNIDLNEELNIRIFSFPMRYQPTNQKDRTHVGPNWNRYFLRSMQIILQATHGIVSGAPSFFKRAFGDSAEDFERLLSRPEHFIFNRVWYEELAGKSEFAEFNAQFSKLSDGERAELIALLSAAKPSQFASLRKTTKSKRIASILAFYLPLPEEREQEIWSVCREHRLKQKQVDVSIPDDQRVEDAGLTEAA